MLYGKIPAAVLVQFVRRIGAQEQKKRVEVMSNVMLVLNQSIKKLSVVSIECKRNLCLCGEVGHNAAEASQHASMCLNVVRGAAIVLVGKHILCKYRECKMAVCIRLK